MNHILAFETLSPQRLPEKIFTLQQQWSNRRLTEDRCALTVVLRQPAQMMTWPKCAGCNQPISASDSLSFNGDEIRHLDCRRPQELSHEERALLFRYCFDHEAANCLACTRRFRQYELMSNLISNHTHLCPRCRADLTESLRGHIYSCVALPEETRRAARAVRDAALRLVKDSRGLKDRADVLMREAEAALAALRKAMRRTG